MPLFAAPGLDHDWSVPLHEPLAEPKLERAPRPVQHHIITHRPISVLFVDERNKVRSVLAQALAEITRIATLNQTGHNIFYRLDSAGLRVESSLTRKGGWVPSRAGERPNETALDALICAPQSREGQDLKQRFAEKQYARGIEYEDFDKFDFILAFDESTLADLRVLEWAAYRRARRLGKPGLRAQTRYLGEFGARSVGGGAPPVRIPRPAVGRQQRRSDFDGSIRLIEAELHNFLRAVTGWTKPERVAVDAVSAVSGSSLSSGTRFRSRQFLARKSRVTEAKVRTLRLLYDNRVFVDEPVQGREYRTVTITARDGAALRQALEHARAAFS